MKKSLIAALLALCLVLLIHYGRPSAPAEPLYAPSASLPDYTQASFEEYVTQTRNWVASNRYFLTPDKAAEIAANTPFEIRPPLQKKPKRGILLVHGLGDSPGYFKDVADVLALEGFLVRAMLLPGHGSRPADLMLPTIGDWYSALQHQINLLAAEVDEIWLGGFSTGANLVTTHAVRSENISGLLLFSPGFVPKDKLLALAPIASAFVDWFDIDEPTQNYMRYESLSANAAELYLQTTEDVRSSLAKKEFAKPALIVMSSDDSVIDPYGVLDVFEEYFTNPQSRFIWYGPRPETSEKRVIVYSSRLPEQRISNFSHLSVLFSPAHTYYGRNGNFKMLENGQNIPIAESSNYEMWYSAYGYNEPHKYHARLTWNPRFEELVTYIKAILAITPS